MKKIAVVILNWNGLDMMKRFLPGVVKDSPEADVVVADNASTDESVAWLEREMPEVRRIVLDQNYGFAEATTEGLQDLTRHSRQRQRRAPSTTCF